MEFKEGLHKTLGMEFLPEAEDGSRIARIKIDERHIQHLGYANGGVFLSLAETVAGFASAQMCPDKVCFGASVYGNHLHPASVGEVITAKAHLIQKGKHTHIWDVELTNENGVLVHKSIVTNRIIDAKPGK